MAAPPNAQELVQALGYEHASLLKKGFVLIQTEQARFGRDALRVERSGAGFLDYRRGIVEGRLVADLAIGLATNEA